MTRLFATAMLCLTAIVGRTAEFTAANCTIGAVSNALALCAASGDAVFIPAGTASWTNGLYVTNHVSIYGAGRGVTIISNAIPDATANPYTHLFYFNLLFHSKTSWFGNLTITEDPSQPALFASASTMVEGNNKDGRRMAITNINYKSCHGNALRIESAFGVAHGCQFDEPSGGIAVYGYHRTINGYTEGHGSWSTNVVAGSDQMWYLENCGFNFLPTGFTYTTVDGYAGWRYCARYCNFTNQTLEGHGFEAGEARGTRYVEGYMNYFKNTNGGAIATYLRSGEQLYMSNTCEGLSSTAPFNLLVDRVYDELSVIAGANGRNPFDSNTTAISTHTASSAGNLTVTVTGAGWTPSEHIGRTIHRTSGISISSMTRAGGVITVNTAAPHGFANEGGFISNVVTICGATQVGYNGAYRGYYPYGYVQYVDADTFTLTASYATASPATGTMYVVTNNSFSIITANTSDTITFADSGYTGQGAPAVSSLKLTMHAGDTFEINQLTHVVDQPGAGVSTAQSSSPPDPTGWSQGLAMCYEWGNTNTSGVAMHFAPQYPQIIVAGRHYTNAVKSGYSPLSYPHPILTGADGGGAGGEGSVGTRGNKIRVRLRP